LHGASVGRLRLELMLKLAGGLKSQHRAPLTYIVPLVRS
jgi:hypothetical protein